MAGAERVILFLDREPDWHDLPDAKPLGDSIRGDLTVQNVAFEYEPGRPVLTDINLEGTAGQFAALVGETSSGKSTLANLMARFHLPD